MAARKKLIIIAGMHRSGTSAVTGLVRDLGVTLGDNLAAGHKGINDKGYMEDLALIDLHETLLWSLPSAWFDIEPVDLNAVPEAGKQQALEAMKELLGGYFKQADICAIKDPRLCLFIPFWIEACEQLCIDIQFIIPIRHPNSVAASIEKRDNIPAELSLLIWAKYMLASEAYTRGYSRMFVAYEALVQTPSEHASQLADWIGVEEKAKNLEGGFITKSLNRNSGAGNAAISNSCVADLYNLLCKLAQNQESDSLQEEIAAAEKRYLHELNTIGALPKALLQAYREQAARYKRYYDETVSSRTMRFATALKHMVGIKT